MAAEMYAQSVRAVFSVLESDFTNARAELESHLAAREVEMAWEWGRNASQEEMFESIASALSS